MVVRGYVDHCFRYYCVCNDLDTSVPSTTLPSLVRDSLRLHSITPTLSNTVDEVYPLLSYIIIIRSLLFTLE